MLLLIFLLKAGYQNYQCGCKLYFSNLSYRLRSKWNSHLWWYFCSCGCRSGISEYYRKRTFRLKIFELDSRWVSSIMTTRDEILFGSGRYSKKNSREKIMDYPHNKFLITASDIDSILGYITSKDLLPSIMLNQKPISELIKNYRKNLLILPNTLTLSETFGSFQRSSGRFCYYFKWIWVSRRTGNHERRGKYSYGRYCISKFGGPNHWARRTLLVDWRSNSDWRCEKSIGKNWEVSRRR